MTCIQSVVLLPIVLMHAGGIKRLASWIAAALRMAQLLDLHKLDDSGATGQHSGGKNGTNNSNNASNGLGSRRTQAGSTLTPVEREIGKRELLKPHLLYRLLCLGPLRAHDTLFSTFFNRSVFLSDSRRGQLRFEMARTWFQLRRAQ